MNTKTALPILYCVIFGLIVWTMTNIYSDRLMTGLSIVKDLQKQVQIKQSFANQKSPEILLNRINEFAPDSLDKSKITTELAQLARESNIELSSIIIDDKISKINVPNIDEEANPDQAPIIDVPVNTLKSANMSLTMTGGRREIYAFLTKLTQSNRYIGINNISLSFEKGLGSIDGSITTTIYYKGV